MDRAWTAAAATALTLAAPGAWAADPRFCADYARSAASQAQTAGRTPACKAGGLAGVRWSPDYQAQFTWCTTVTQEAATAERNARTAFLISCRRM